MKTLMTRTFINAFLVATLGSYAGQLAAQTVTVYKSPTCGCCTGWVDYLRDHDFEVEIFDIHDLDPIKEQYGVNHRLQSCHTALVDGYVVEGHVPVDDIRRLLEEKPHIKGLSAPGMPPMSPGMASLTPKNYDVLSFDEHGKVEVFSEY